MQFDCFRCWGGCSCCRVQQRGVPQLLLADCWSHKVCCKACSSCAQCRPFQVLLIVRASHHCFQSSKLEACQKCIVHCTCAPLSPLLPAALLLLPLCSSCHHACSAAHCLPGRHDHRGCCVDAHSLRDLHSNCWDSCFIAVHNASMVWIPFLQSFLARGSVGCR